MSLFTPFLIKELLFVLPIEWTAEPQIFRKLLKICDPRCPVARWSGRGVGLFVRLITHIRPYKIPSQAKASFGRPVVHHQRFQRQGILP